MYSEAAKQKLAQAGVRWVVAYRCSRQHRTVAFVQSYATKEEAQVFADMLASSHPNKKLTVLPVPPDWETRGTGKGGAR